MSKAEDRYLDLFQDGRLRNCSRKDAFLLGYHQAEEDLRKSIYKAGLLDGFEDAVEGQYEKGYEQAEKDLELSWEDIPKILSICENLKTSWWFRDNEQTKQIGEQTFWEEVLKRFKAQKGE